MSVRSVAQLYSVAHTLLTRCAGILCTYIRNIQHLWKWHLRVMLRIYSPICSKTLLVTSHLNLQQPTWNIPSFAGKQYNSVLSDTIPCGYLHIANPFFVGLSRPDPALMLLRDTTYGMPAKSFQNTSSNTNKLLSATNTCWSLELGPGSPVLLPPF